MGQSGQVIPTSIRDSRDPLAREIKYSKPLEPSGRWVLHEPTVMENVCFCSLRYRILLLCNGLRRLQSRFLNKNNVNKVRANQFYWRQPLGLVGWGSQWWQKKANQITLQQDSWICCVVSRLGSSRSEFQHSRISNKWNLQGLKCKFPLCALLDKWSLLLNNATDTVLPNLSLFHIHLILFIREMDGYIIFSIQSAQRKRDTWR